MTQRLPGFADALPFLVLGPPGRQEAADELGFAEHRVEGGQRGGLFVVDGPGHNVAFEFGGVFLAQPHDVDEQFVDFRLGAVVQEGVGGDGGEGGAKGGPMRAALRVGVAIAGTRTVAVGLRRRWVAGSGSCESAAVFLMGLPVIGLASAEVLETSIQRQ